MKALNQLAFLCILAFTLATSLPVKAVEAFESRRKAILQPYLFQYPEHRDEIEKLFENETKDGLSLREVYMNLEQKRSQWAATPSDFRLRNFTWSSQTQWPNQISVPLVRFLKNNHQGDIASSEITTTHGIAIEGTNQLFAEDEYWNFIKIRDSHEFDIAGSTKMDFDTGRIIVSVREKGLVVINQALAGIEDILRLPSKYAAGKVQVQGRQVFVAFGTEGFGIVNLDTLDFRLSTQIPNLKNKKIAAYDFAFDEGRIYIAGGPNRKVYVINEKDLQPIGVIKTNFGPTYLDIRNQMTSGLKWDGDNIYLDESTVTLNSERRLYIAANFKEEEKKIEGLHLKPFSNFEFCFRLMGWLNQRKRM